MRLAQLPELSRRFSRRNSIHLAASSSLSHRFQQGNRKLTNRISNNELPFAPVHTARMCETSSHFGITLKFAIRFTAVESGAFRRSSLAKLPSKSGDPLEISYSRPPVKENRHKRETLNLLVSLCVTQLLRDKQTIERNVNTGTRLLIAKRSTVSHQLIGRVA